MKKSQLNYGNLRLLTVTAWAIALMVFGVGQYFDDTDQYPPLIALTGATSVLGATTGLFGAIHRAKSAPTGQPAAVTANQSAMLGMVGAACLIVLTQTTTAPVILQQAAMGLMVIGMVIFAVTGVLKLMAKTTETRDSATDKT